MKFTTFHSAIERIILGAGALSLLSSVGADFAQCLAGWEWSYNSLGQNPCEIAGSLQAPCLGYSTYVLGPIGNNSNYVTPQQNDTKAKECGCNTVIYSLYAACATCQFTNATPLTWQFWSQFCDNVYVTQYPFSIPFNSSVPHWAFLNDTNPSFDPVLAKAAGRDPEATPTSPPTVSISSTRTSQTASPAVATSSTRTSLNPSSSTSGVSGSTKSNTGAIAGGVVGGLVGLGALSALAFFFLKRRRASGGPNGILGSNQMAYNPAGSGQPLDAPRLYDPSDPSTFPSPLSGGDSSNSGGYTTNSFQGGRYQGAAEL